MSDQATAAQPEPAEFPEYRATVLQELGWHGINTTICVLLVALAYAAHEIFGGKAFNIVASSSIFVLGFIACFHTSRRLNNLCMAVDAVRRTPRILPNSYNVALPMMVSLISVELLMTVAMGLAPQFGVESPRLGLISFGASSRAVDLAAIALCMPMLVFIATSFTFNRMRGIYNRNISAD